MASSRHANKDTLGESNSSRDLRAQEWRIWPSQAFGDSLAHLRLVPNEVAFDLPQRPSRLILHSVVVNGVHKSYLDSPSPVRS